MPRARKTLISLDTTPYYHCTSRCVRRAFLCGEDQHSGRNYEHRRQWIEDRLLMLAGIYAIDIAAYAIMSNHYHVVLYVDLQRGLDWSDAEVIERWHRLFRGSELSRRYSRGEALDRAGQHALAEHVTEWRERLVSISWFMRCLNEPIARDANREDNVTGRFWEGRYSSQALLDEKALVACMVYVDLNPIRARMATTPESSKHTSVQYRINKARRTKLQNRIDQQPEQLLPFAGNPRNDMPAGLPFRLNDYLELVDWSGRILREEKKGAISDELPAILQRLQLDTRNWCYLTRNFEHPFKHLVGAAHHVRRACEAIGQRWAQGVSQCERLFSSA
ncbi:MAG: transposase [Gammaproteobacteria bacterium]